MALTTYKEPDSWSPVYNHLTFDVGSSDYAEPNMKYIFKLYVNGDLVNTSKLFPNQDGHAIYEPSKIIKNYVSEYFSNDIGAGVYSNVSETAEYYIEFSEEYTVGSTLTNFPLGTSSTKYVWLCGVQWEAGKSLDEVFDGLIPKSTYSTYDEFPQMLNFRSFYQTEYNTKEAYKIRPTEKRVASLMIRNPDTLYMPNKIVVTTITIEGSSKVFTKAVSYSSSTDPKYQILHQPVGIEELNDIAWDSILIPFSPLAFNSYIDPTEDVGYVVSFLNDSTYTHKQVSFEIDTCTRYDKYTVMFKCPYGGWGYIPMSMKSYKSENAVRTSMDTYLPYNYGNSSSTSKLITSDIRGSRILSTELLRSQARSDEVVDMLRSPVIYLIDENGNYIPVIIKNSTYDVQSVDQEKMVSYTVEFNEAFRKNITI